MIRYQIRLCLGGTSYSYLYIDSNPNISQKELEESISLAVTKYSERAGEHTRFFSYSYKVNPTVHVKEYDTKINKPLRSGNHFKMKWK